MDDALIIVAFLINVVDCFLVDSSCRNRTFYRFFESLSRSFYKVIQGRARVLRSLPLDHEGHSFRCCASRGQPRCLSLQNRPCRQNCLRAGSSACGFIFTLSRSSSTIWRRSIFSKRSFCSVEVKREKSATNRARRPQPHGSALPYSAFVSVYLALMLMALLRYGRFSGVVFSG